MKQKWDQREMRAGRHLPPLLRVGKIRRGTAAPNFDMPDVQKAKSRRPMADSIQVSDGAQGHYHPGHTQPENIFSYVGGGCQRGGHLTYTRS